MFPLSAIGRVRRQANLAQARCEFKHTGSHDRVRQAQLACADPARVRSRTGPPGGRPFETPGDTPGMDDERPPICPACGVTMVPAALSARRPTDGDWVCLECEEADEPG